MTEKLNIYQKLLAAMKEVRYIEKEKKTVNNQYRFVSHDAVTSATSEAFIKHGIYAKPRIIKNDITTIQVEKYNKYEKITINENYFVCTVEIEYDFINAENPEDRITGINGLGQGIDSQDKACGKAISYACKYALLKALGIETGDDPEKDTDYKIATVELINQDQGLEIENLCKKKGFDIKKICEAYKINTIIELPNAKFSQVIKALNLKKDAIEVDNANN
jgi:hypothetical protein